MKGVLNTANISEIKSRPPTAILNCQSREYGVEMRVKREREDE